MISEIPRLTSGLANWVLCGRSSERAIRPSKLVALLTTPTDNLKSNCKHIVESGLAKAALPFAHKSTTVSCCDGVRISDAALHCLSVE